MIGQGKVFALTKKGFNVWSDFIKCDCSYEYVLALLALRVQIDQSPRILTIGKKIY